MGRESAGPPRSGECSAGACTCCAVGVVAVSDTEPRSGAVGVPPEEKTAPSRSAAPAGLLALADGDD
eukprot:141271-Rhodomonas_salina.1